MSAATILVVGLSAAGAAELPPMLLERIRAADLLAGGQRHLAYFPEHAGETIVIGASVELLVKRLELACARGERAVVLASGDPLWYGIGATLRRTFPAEALEIVPSPASFQLAFAALAEPWHDAALLSAHARPLEDIIPVILAAPKAAILTDNDHTPAALAAALLAAGMPSVTPCAICESLGSPNQLIIRTTLAEAAEGMYAPLNVFVVMRDAGCGGEKTVGSRQSAEDEMRDARCETRDDEPSTQNSKLKTQNFSTEAGQITKREIRLLSLGELALQPGEVLWDIGAGSGSVAIEAARSQPEARIFAVERRAIFIDHIHENLRRFPATNVVVVPGTATEACAALPDPHAVFVGGSGGHLAEIVQTAQERLHPNGRLVLNLVTLEHLATLRAVLPAARVYQAQISRGVPIQDMLRFEALNPVWIAVWTKASDRAIE